MVCFKFLARRAPSVVLYAVSQRYFRHRCGTSATATKLLCFHEVHYMQLVAKVDRVYIRIQQKETWET